MEKKKTTASKRSTVTAKKTTGKTASAKTSGRTPAANNTPVKNSGGDKAMSKSQSQLYDFFIEELKDLHGAEKQLLKALPKMHKAATTNELKAAIESHLHETEEHVARIEEVFQLLDEKPKTKKCEAMAGIIKEGEEVIKDTEKGSMTRDVGLIFAAQKVEHYEIASYGGMIQLAKTLGHNDIGALLLETLTEEKGADEKLTKIAEGYVNQSAAKEA